MDPITQYILKEAFGKPKSKFKGEELYYGLEFSIQEYKKMIGGEGVFKKILKKLKKMIDDDIKKGRKQGLAIPRDPIKYVPDEFATVSTTGNKGKLYIQYKLNADDSTGHRMSATWQIDFKLTKGYTDVSGWDG